MIRAYPFVTGGRFWISSMARQETDISIVNRAKPLQYVVAAVVQGLVETRLKDNKIRVAQYKKSIRIIDLIMY